MHSGVWNVWWNDKGDVYIASRMIAGEVKMSLHSGDERHVGQTGKSAKEQSIQGKERHWDKWNRTFIPNTSLSFECSIYVPTSHLRNYKLPSQVLSKDISWLVPAIEGKQVDINFFISDSEEEKPPVLPNSENNELLHQIKLENGRVLWITQNHSNEAIIPNMGEVKNAVFREGVDEIFTYLNRLILIGRNINFNISTLQDLAADTLND